MIKKRMIGGCALALMLLISYGCQREVKPIKEESSLEASSSETSSEKERETSESSATHIHFEPNELLARVKEDKLAEVEMILSDQDYAIDETDQEGNTPLNVAVHQNQIEIAERLIDRGADINQQNNMSDSPYLYAGAEGRKEILAYMLSQSEPNLSKVNRYGGNALIPAAEKGHLDTVKLLLADGRVEIDFQNNYGYTALIETVALNDGSSLYQEIAKVLLENGADKSLRDQSGRTALDYATAYQYEEMRQLLTN